MRNTSRRTVLAGIGGAALLPGIGRAKGDEGGASGDVQRTTYTLLPRTKQATTIYSINAAADGPAGIILGGMHGDEEAGYVAADQLTDFPLDAGELVIVPKANKYAVERGTRLGLNGDLNRQFPIGEEPLTTLAQKIWFVTKLVDPDFVVDLHESRGVFDGSEPSFGVGQSIAYGPEEARKTAFATVRCLNENYTFNSRNRFTMRPNRVTDSPSDLYVDKVQAERNAEIYLSETYEGVPLSKRTRWHREFVESLLERKGMFSDRY